MRLAIQPHPGKAPADRRPRRPAAFTLLEVMMATGVLSMALSSAIIALQCGFRSLDTARISTAASQMMQSEMERIRLLNWEAVCALPAEEEVDLSTMHSTATIEGDRVTVIRRVQPVAGFNGDMKEITVTATWTAIDGHPAIRVFRMRYARNGLFDYYYNYAQT